MKTNRTRMRRYAFRREDNDKIIWVDRATMFEQDVAGFITLPDGVAARRCVYLEGGVPRRAPQEQRTTPMPVVSDALGFPAQCLKDRQAQLETLRQRHGVTGIEFRRDPRVPEFYQVHCASEAARDWYAKRRNMVNRTGSLGGGVMLSQEDLDRAAELVSRD